MAVIGFSDKADHIWHGRGWVFRQILDDVASKYPEDPEMIEEFRQAKHYYNGLSIYSLDSNLASRVTSAIREVAEGILAGTIRSGIHDEPHNDEAIFEGYRERLRELIDTINRATGS